MFATDSTSSVKRSITAAFEPGQATRVTVTSRINTRRSSFKELHNMRIANLVPDDASRRFIANRVEGLMQDKGFAYKFFTDSEEATEWLNGP